MVTSLPPPPFPRHSEFQMQMAIQWMTWTKYAMDTFGAPLEPPHKRNDFGISFKHSHCVNYLQCPNDYCDYMYHNGGVPNTTEWIESTPIPFYVGNEAHEKSNLKCKVCHSTHMCIVFCHSRMRFVILHPSQGCRGLVFI